MALVAFQEKGTLHIQVPSAPELEVTFAFGSKEQSIEQIKEVAFQVYGSSQLHVPLVRVMLSVLEIKEQFQSQDEEGEDQE